MFGWLAQLLAFFYRVWPSYGGAIILLTLAIMVVLLPLTLKGTRSMLEMQRLQPEMKKLQNKYKDDRAKLNEEMLALYREHKVNPVGGCLPMLLQLPVFWVMYRVLLGLTHRAPTGQDLGAAVTGSTSAISRAGHFNPSYISHTSPLYESLHATSKMMSFGVDLSESVTTALKHGAGHAAPFILLVAIVIVTTYVQQVQMQARVPKDQVNPQQQLMMKVMPFMFAVIYLFIPAGVVLYFLVSNVFRIIQQAFITRTMYADAPMPAPSPKSADAPRGLRALLLPGSDSMPRVGQRARAQGNNGRDKQPAKARSGGGGGSARSGGGNQRSKAQPAAKPAARSNGNGRPGAPARKGPPPPNRSGSKKKRK